MEMLIAWHDRLLQLRRRNLAFLLLSKSVFRRDIAIEDARVKDLEDDVEDDQDSQKATCCIKQERHIEKDGPNN